MDSGGNIFQRVVEVLLYNSLDRKLYFRLVRRLKQDPRNARRSVAIWIWLESIGHDNFVAQVSSYADDLLIAIFKEAQRCFKAIMGGLLPYTDFSIPLTSGLINEPIDLGFFLFNRQVVYDGICQIIDIICNAIFDDGLLLVIYRDGFNTLSPESMEVSSVIQPTLEWMNLYGASLWPLIDGVAGQRGEVKFSEPDTEAAIIRALDTAVSPPDPIADDAKRRSLFISFIRDLPVGREHIIAYFNSKYGHCLESVTLERSPADQRLPMYGRIVFLDMREMMSVMKGKQSASFEIHGRYLWARMYKPPKCYDSIHHDQTW